MATSAVLALLLVGPGLAGAAGSPKQAACAPGAAGCAASQEHLLLQRSKPALQRAALDRDYPEVIYFDAVARDFTADHRDFQSFDGMASGLVEQQLGPDSKPVYRGGAVLSNKANFDQWYHDVPGVNKRVPVKLALKHTTDGTYVYEDSSFFPIDGKGWGDTNVALDGKPHNFYFTLELVTNFVYRGGETFRFRGDDDVWVFINGQLVIDLGGVHNPIEGSVDLDTLNLTPGTSVNLHFFFAERRCCGSNFRLETTIQFPVPAKGTCVLWGDPHVSVFDRSVAVDKSSVPILGMYQSGDFWLVKSQDVSIQGRYGPTRWTGGLSALLSLAVGGPFLRGHTLIIEPMEKGKIMWDGKEVLQAMPSELFIKGFLNVTFHGEEDNHLIDPGQGHLPLRTVTAQLPKIVDLTVNRWSRHIDAIIKMRPLAGGQDGHCGTFNHDPSDDTQDQINARIGGEVSAAETLFGAWPEALGAHGAGIESMGEKTLSDCQPKLRQEAERRCKAAHQAMSGVISSKEVFDACVFDVCFGGKEFAAEDAATAQESQGM